MSYELHHGDCLEVMPTLAENSVDTIITDPPYGLDFMGKNWDKGVPGVEFWKEALRVAKPGATLLAFGGTRTFHRLTCAIEDAGWEIRDCIMWLYGSGFPKSLDISKAIDRAAGAEREIAGRYVRPNGTSRTTSGGRTQDTFHANRVEGDNLITAPATPLAQQWDGWGTALKPAWEPIIVAQKPVEGTYAANAEKWGVAGLWIDGGRIETSDDLSGGTYGGTFSGSRNEDGSLCKAIGSGDKGRFPANLILDEEAGAILDEQSEGASRFFYCAKASRSERNAGLEGMEAKEVRRHGDTGPSDNAKPNGQKAIVEANTHPTVKPLSLMRYLARLTKTPMGGVVLDPFMGSGSTGVGCLWEGRSFVGIELDTEHGYFEIAQGRLENALREIEAEAERKRTEANKPHTMEMFA